MKTISGKHLCRLLEKKGWHKRAITGSHHIYMKQGRKERISVPVHGNKDLKKGLLRAVMSIAQIDEYEL